MFKKTFVCFLFVWIMCVGCERQTPETFVIDQFKKTLHDPKSLEVISVETSELNWRYIGVFPSEVYHKMRAKELANGDPFTVFHIQFRASNAFGALRLSDIYAVYGYGVITSDAHSESGDTFGRFCYFVDPKSK